MSIQALVETRDRPVEKKNGSVGLPFVLTD